MIIISLFLVLVLILGFLLSNGFRLRNIYSGSDCYFQYSAAEHIKKNHYKMYDSIRYYSLPSAPDYPPLLHYLLAFLPSHKLVSYGRFLGSFFDIIHKISVFLLTLAITHQPLIALFAVILFSLVNSLSLDQVEASGRSMGSFFFTLLLASFFFYQQTHHFIFFLLAILILSLGFMSLKFFIQTTALTSLFLTLYFLDITYLLVFVLAFLLLFIFLREKFLVIIKTLFFTLRIWFSMRNTPHPGKKGYSAFKVSLFYFYLVGLIDLLLFFSLIFFKFHLPQEFYFFLVVAIFFRVLSFLVFYVKWFFCIGEAYRYFSYNAFPSALCLSYLLVTYWTHLPFLILTVITSLLAIFSLLLWQKEYQRNKLLFPTNALLRCINRLKKYPIKNLLVVPTPYSRNVAFLTKKKVCFAISQQYFHLIREFLWNVGNVQDAIKRNKVSHIFVHKDYALFDRYSLPHAKILFSDEFVLYKMPSSLFKK